jgi:hypothetical protein
MEPGRVEAEAEAVAEAAEAEIGELSSKLKVILATASVGGTLLVVAIGYLAYLWLCRRSKKEGGYSSVRHSLDHEEKQFQRHIQDVNANMEDLFYFEDDAALEDDVKFDRGDLEKLKILDDLRDKLSSALDGDRGNVNAKGESGGSEEGIKLEIGTPEHIACAASDQRIPRLEPPESDGKRPLEKDVSEKDRTAKTDEAAAERRDSLRSPSSGATASTVETAPASCLPKSNASRQRSGSRSRSRSGSPAPGTVVRRQG